MSKSLTLFLVLGALAFASCSSESKELETADVDVPEVLSETDADSQAASEITDGDSAEAALKKMEEELGD